MDLQAEKNWIISELNKINDEALIQAFKNLLDFARKKSFEVKHEPMSLEEFYKRIEESESDIKNGRTKTHEEVKQLVASWKKKKLFGKRKPSLSRINKVATKTLKH